MKIAITGANGFIGGHLARRFAARGDSVAGISRRRPAFLAPEAFVRAELGEDLDPAALRGADLVVHAAHDLAPGTYRKNVDGTRRWFDQARAAGVASQIFLTSYMAHPESPSEYGRAKHALEDYVTRNGGIALRLGLVVGEGGIFAGLVGMLRKLPVVPVIGGNRIAMAVSDIDTLSEVVLRFSSLRAGAIYNLFLPEQPGFLDLLRSMRRHYGLHTLLLPLPIGPAKLLLRLAEAAGVRLEFSLERFSALEKSQGYNYPSSYAELGIQGKSLSEILDLSRAHATGPPG